MRSRSSRGALPPPSCRRWRMSLSEREGVEERPPTNGRGLRVGWHLARLRHPPSHGLRPANRASFVHLSPSTGERLPHFFAALASGTPASRNTWSKTGSGEPVVKKPPSRFASAYTST